MAGGKCGIGQDVGEDCGKGWGDASLRYSYSSINMGKQDKIASGQGGASEQVNGQGGQGYEAAVHGELGAAIKAGQGEAVQFYAPKGYAVGVNADVAPMQRKIIPYANSSAGSISTAKFQAAERVVAKVDELVAQARELALDWSSFKDSESGYLKSWAETAEAYFSNPDEVKEFLHARFGYAVETLCCQGLNVKEEGLTVNFQVASGMTRPDIVLTDPDSKEAEVAWIDITASDSTGHIKKKAGSGWATRPVVAEVTYPSLDPTELLQHNSSAILQGIGQLNLKKHAVSQAHKELAMENLQDDFDMFIADSEHNFSSSSGNQSKKKKAVTGFFEAQGLLSADSKHSQQTAKSALVKMGKTPGHFGYKKGGQSQSELNRWINQVAEPGISIEHEAILAETSSSQQQALKPSLAIPMVSSLSAMATLAVDEKTVHTGIGVTAALELYKYFQGSLLRFKSAGSGIGSDLLAAIADATKKVNAAIMGFPDVADLTKIQAWYAEGSKLKQYVGTILEEVNKRTMVDEVD